MVPSLKNALNNPFIYSMAMKILGSDRMKPTFVREYIRPEKGNKLLDFGCGPAKILDYLPEDIVYVGVDFNKKNIEYAKRKYGARGTFILGNVAKDIYSDFLDQFDIVLAHGLIHHLTDEEAAIFLKKASGCLKKGGRIVTIDNVYDDNLSIINKIALRLDRGAYIRNKSDHLALFAEFPDVQCNIVKSKHRIPYYHIICEAKIR